MLNVLMEYHTSIMSLRTRCALTRATGYFRHARCEFWWYPPANRCAEKTVPFYNSVLHKHKEIDSYAQLICLDSYTALCQGVNIDSSELLRTVLCMRARRHGSTRGPARVCGMVHDKSTRAGLALWRRTEKRTKSHAHVPALKLV